MKMNEMYPSKYMGKDDLAHPVVAIIGEVVREEVKGEGDEKELKTVMYFNNLPKPFILNKGNGVTVSEFYGDDSDMWIGKPIELYVDPSIMFGGKRIGGVRVRRPTTAMYAGGPPPDGSGPPPDGSHAEPRYWCNFGHRGATVPRSAILALRNDPSDMTDWNTARVCLAGQTEWQNFSAVADLNPPPPPPVPPISANPPASTPPQDVQAAHLPPGNPSTAPVDEDSPVPPGLLEAANALADTYAAEAKVESGKYKYGVAVANGWRTGMNYTRKMVTGMLATINADIAAHAAKPKALPNPNDSTEAVALLEFIAAEGAKLVEAGKDQPGGLTKHLTTKSAEAGYGWDIADFRGEQITTTRKWVVEYVAKKLENPPAP